MSVGCVLDQASGQQQALVGFEGKVTHGYSAAQGQRPNRSTAQGPALYCDSISMKFKNRENRLTVLEVSDYCQTEEG